MNAAFNPPKLMAFCAVWTPRAIASGTESADRSSSLKTAYSLFNGSTVTLNGTTGSCAATAPSASLPCATINGDGVPTQIAYDSAGDLTSSSTPDGNGSQDAVTTYAYDSGRAGPVVAGGVPGRARRGRPVLVGPTDRETAARFTARGQDPAADIR
jgi:YD repeat-containing protein